MQVSDARTGERLGRFSLVRQIGAGGMGVVHEAHDPELDRHVAIKVLRPSTAGTLHGQEARARLRREAQAMARLSHPNVASVYEVGETDEHIFIVMELVSGSTLRGWLAACERSPAEILEVFAQAGRGLEAAHAAGLVHRDFKPENVLIGADGRARVVDFGLVGAGQAVMADRTVTEVALPEAVATELTRTGALVGTPSYMAPEQHEGRATDARTDQFSFCVALWEALWHERPFGGATYRELVESVCSGRIREPPADTAVPARIGRILRRGLRVDRAERYPSLGELLDELVAPTAAEPRRRSRWPVAVGAVMLGAALVVWWQASDREPAPRFAPATQASPATAAMPRSSESVRAVPVADAPAANAQPRSTEAPAPESTSTAPPPATPARTAPVERRTAGPANAPTPRRSDEDLGPREPARRVPDPEPSTSEATERRRRQLELSE